MIKLITQRYLASRRALKIVNKLPEGEFKAINRVKIIVTMNDLKKSIDSFNRALQADIARVTKPTYRFNK